jgi:hypothetical protein
MPTELYNNFTVNKKARLDSKLEMVANSYNLPDPNLGTNFIYEGAEVYVSSEKANYQAQDDPDNPGTLIWVKVGGSSEELVTGAIIISSTDTVLDLSSVNPSISTCDNVIVKVTGDDVTINSITNFPENQPIKFQAFAGNTVTFTHTELSEGGAGDIILELPYPYTLIGRTSAKETLTLVNYNDSKSSGGIISQVTGEQFVSEDDIVSILGDLKTTVTDNLTSTSALDALSANQGRVLANMVSNVNNFQVGGLLSFNSDNTVLTGNHPEFIQTIAPDGTSNVINYLTTSIPSIAKHRLVEFTNSGTTADGVWLLGAQQNPTLSSNWIQISKTISSTRPWAIYDILPSGTVDTDAESNGDYFLRFYEEPVDYDGVSNVTFDSVSVSRPASRVNMKLSVGKTYSIEVQVSLSTNGHGQFFLNSHSSSSFGSTTDAIPGTRGVTNGTPVYTGIVNANNTSSLLPYAVTANYSEIAKIEQGDNDILSFAWGHTSTPTVSDRTVIGGRIIIKEITPGS